MSKTVWYIVCDEGHMYPIDISNLVEENTVCRYCGSGKTRVFCDELIIGNPDMFKKPIGQQTVLCKNLDTGHCWHEKINIYRVKHLFEKDK